MAKRVTSEQAETARDLMVELQEAVAEADCDFAHSRTLADLTRRSDHRRVARAARAVKKNRLALKAFAKGTESGGNSTPQDVTFLARCLLADLMNAVNALDSAELDYAKTAGRLE